jgi:hypothetical protein
MKLETVKQKASEKIEELENPESIRTPGRTWTRYPEVSPEESEVSPEIETEGEAEVLKGKEAVEAAGEKLFDAVKYDEDKLTAVHAANLNSIIYIRPEGKASVKITYEDRADTFAHVIVDAEDNSELDLTE